MDAQTASASSMAASVLRGLRLPHSGAAKWLYLRLLGLTYLVAFVSFAVQARGLIGDTGILPVAEYLNGVAAQLGTARYWTLPTLSWWLGTSADAVIVLAWVGAAAAVIQMLGILELPILIFLWAAYLSVCAAGQDFLEFQWDMLLLEAGLLSIFVAPCHIRPRQPSRESQPNPVGWWLLRWLIIRLMLQSGLVKLWSGDSTWRNLTALSFHYETQPLPTWLGWATHQLPMGLHKTSLLLTFAIELLVPWLVFGPRRVRAAAAAAFVALQAVIAVTGNYGFFNLLTIALCVPLLDDSLLPKRFRRADPQTESDAEAAEPESPRLRIPLRNLLMIPVAAVVVSITVTQTLARGRLIEHVPRPLITLIRASWPFKSLNAYGLFAVMTTAREEISVEGSVDGREWTPYLFRYKPCEADRRPGFLQPHMPRLDWQMWFAALGSLRNNPWLVAFQMRLLEGSPETLALLRSNPFPSEPPRFVRTRIAPYRFSSVRHWRSTGEWWIIGEPKAYGPILTLQDGELRTVSISGQ